MMTSYSAQVSRKLFYKFLVRLSLGRHHVTSMVLYLFQILEEKIAFITCFCLFGRFLGWFRRWVLFYPFPPKCCNQFVFQATWQPTMVLTISTVLIMLNHSLSVSSSVLRLSTQLGELSDLISVTNQNQKNPSLSDLNIRKKVSHNFGFLRKRERKKEREILHKNFN